MFGRPTLNDQILRAYIEQVFGKYDKDKSGGLDAKQLTLFFNDLFKILNIPSTITEEQAAASIKSMDQNGDNNIDKKQLFDAFKMIMDKINAQQFQNNMNPYFCKQQPNMMNFNQPQHTFGQPPMHPNFPMHNNYAPQYPPGYTNQGWTNDPMLANMKSPFSNPNMQNNINPTQNMNTNNQQPQYPPHNNMGGIGMSTSKFGGGWSKRRV